MLETDRLDFPAVTGSGMKKSRDSDEAESETGKVESETGKVTAHKNGTGNGANVACFLTHLDPLV